MHSLISHLPQVLESVEDLDISYNALHDLSFLSVFVGVRTVNVSYNHVNDKEGFNYLSQVKTLTTLSIKGIIFMSTVYCHLRHYSLKLDVLLW